MGSEMCIRDSMGQDWANPRTFRFGASSLLDDLLGRSGDRGGY